MWALAVLAVVGHSAKAQHVGHDDPDHLCATDGTSAEARQSLENFRLAREAGLLRKAAKSASPPDIGDRRVFRVSEDDWTEVEFELLDKEDDLYFLWASIHELATGRITADVIASLRSALVESTPGGLINPDAGVMANNEALLGPPPNYDGDGVTDVLLYDIDPNDDTPGSFIAGYVSSTDINPNAADDAGNQADVLYLDSNQGINNGSIASTAAHEYAHLIHFNTGFDTETFISEGIAEYLTIVNGLGRSRYSFLTSTQNTGLPLMSWGSGVPNVVADYARAELFFRYVGEQFSPQTVADIAGNPYKSAAGIDSVLSSAGSSLADFVLDFHSANLLNDQRVDGRFGYGPDVESSGVRASVSRAFSGNAANSTPEFADGEKPALESGAVTYVSITNVADLRLFYDAAAAPILLPSARALISARLFLLDQQGITTWFDLTPREDQYVFAGNFLRAQLVFTNVKPGSTVRSRYDYTATWSDFGQATPVDDRPELPESITLDQNYPNPFNPATRIDFTLSEAGPARLTIFDQLGREVRTLVNGMLPAGRHSTLFEASTLASGTYIYVLDAGGQRLTKHLSILK